MAEEKVCFVCDKKIAIGELEIISELYHVYKHDTCNTTNTCFVCKRKFKKEDGIRKSDVKNAPSVRIGVNLYRHDACDAGSYQWWKHFNEYMTDEIRKAFSTKIIKEGEEKELEREQKNLTQVVIMKRRKEKREPSLLETE